MPSLSHLRWTTSAHITDEQRPSRFCERAKTLFYERMGRNSVTGSVTRAKLQAGGQSELADELSQFGILPEDDS